MTLGGSTTLNVDITKIPQLNAANTFTGNQTVSGNLSATGVVTGNSYQIEAPSLPSVLQQFERVPRLRGELHDDGRDNTASGVRALYSNTTGLDNTADGYVALYYNTTGSTTPPAAMRRSMTNTRGRKTPPAATVRSTTTPRATTTPPAATLRKHFGQFYLTGNNNTALGTPCNILNGNPHKRHGHRCQR